MPKISPFKLSPKQKGWKFYPTELHYEAQKWCLNNGYKIYPVKRNRDSDLYNICIEFAGTKNIGSKIYSNNEWSDKIWQLELEIYNKRSKKDAQKKN